MLSVPVTPPSGRAGCTACPRGENMTPKSTMSMVTSCHASEGHKSLGRRSLDAVRSIRGSIKGRAALEATTNSQRPPPALRINANSSAVNSPTKTRWFDSLRSRASQIPTPTSPASVSSTLRRSRFFRSSVTPPPKDMNSACGESQVQVFKSLLPKLELPSFQTELQTNAIFSPLSFGTAACDSSQKPEKLILAKHSNTLSTMPAMPDEKKVSRKVSIAEPVFGKEPDQNWQMKCALLYKGSAWVPEERYVFSDAASALSYFAAKNLIGQRRWSNIVLWTGDISYTHPKTKQNFTAYPLYDSPHRIKIDDKYCLEWAFVAFADKQDKRIANKIPPMLSKDMPKEDGSLVTALTKIRFMGYHVDVWTSRDSDRWDVAIEMIREFGMKRHVASKLRTPEYAELRKKYEAFIRHGVAGFSRDDIVLFDKTQNSSKAIVPDTSSEEDYDYADDGYEHDGDDFELVFAPRSRSQQEDVPELHGFLEHQEETIVEDESKEEEKASETLKISVDQEDLDMAARLAGTSIN